MEPNLPPAHLVAIQSIARRAAAPKVSTSLSQQRATRAVVSTSRESPPERVIDVAAPRMEPSAFCRIWDSQVQCGDSRNQWVREKRK